jgi:hypothetical protein
MKRLNLLTIFICITIASCTNKDNCNNSLTIIGKYQNIYDKKAENILIIKSDGTFEQFFKKGTIIKRNNGTWKFSQKSCYVNFDTLKVLHSLPKSVKEYEMSLGKFRNNDIIFVEGLAFEFDFFRIKE